MLNILCRPCVTLCRIVLITPANSFFSFYIQIELDVVLSVRFFGWWREIVPVVLLGARLKGAEKRVALLEVIHFEGDLFDAWHTHHAFICLRPHMLFRRHCPETMR